jgi:cbb3-type cytochrome oxidase maturation protein
MTYTLGLMLSVSLFLGAIGLFAFIWALKTGQFEDEAKMRDGLLYDSEEELNVAKKNEDKRKRYGADLD